MSSGQQSETLSKKEIAALFFALATLVFSYVFGVSSIGFFESEETRYAQMAREMLQNEDWLVPRLREFPLLEKPPLAIWVTAAAFHVFGESEWAGRMVSLLSAAWILYLTLRLGLLLRGRQLALVATFALASTPLFFGVAKILSTDMLFTACVFSSVYFLFRLRKETGLLSMLGLAASASAAVLCKGPIALALIGIALMGISWQDRSLTLWKRSLHPVVCVVFFTLTLPWYLYIGSQFPGFWEFFLNQHVGRFFGMGTIEKDFHASPIYYYLPLLVVGFFPWGLFFAQAVRSAWMQFHSPCDFSARRALWTIGLLYFLFFSLSEGKRVPYVLPIWPLASLGFAMYWCELDRATPRAFSPLRKIWIWFSLLIGVVAFLAREEILSGMDWEPLVGLLPLLMAVVLVGFVLVYVSLKWRKPGLTLLVGSLWMGGLFILSVLEIEQIQEQISMKKMGQRAGDLAREGRVLISCPRFYPGIPFYAHQPMFIYGSPGELDSGIQFEPNRPKPFVRDQIKVMMDEQMPFVLMGSRNTIHHFLKRWDPEGKLLKVVMENANWVLVTN